MAAELGEHALRLTPSDLPEERHRRTITTARAHMAAGDLSHAEALARDLLARSPAGRRRAEALVLLSDVGPDVIELRRDALHEAAADPDLQARIHQRLSWESFFTEGPQVSERHALASLELAEKLGDGGLRAGALAVLATSRFSLGEPDALALTEEALQLAGACNPDVRLWVRLRIASIFVNTDRLDRARPLLEQLLQRVGRARRDGRGQHSLASRQGRALCRPLGARGGRCSPGLGDRQAVRGERSPDDLGGRARRSPSRRPGACARTRGAGTGGGIEPPVHLPSRGRARARCRLERGPTWCRSPIQRSRAADEPRRVARADARQMAPRPRRGAAGARPHRGSGEHPRQLGSGRRPARPRTGARSGGPVPRARRGRARRAWRMPWISSSRRSCGTRRQEIRSVVPGRCSRSE